MTKIDIFSGFLGAGKTTLIKKLINDSFKGEKLVLIENEFGEIGIDGGFLKDAGIEITEMNSGCICCSLVGDFSKALAEVLEKFTPDRILIEPSGVGKLSDVKKAVEGIEGATINSATAVVDATKCKMYMKNFGEFFNDQIENASTIILSHADKASEDKIKECIHLIKEHNENAVLVTTPFMELDGKVLKDAIENTSTLETEMKELEHHHEHHHHDCHCHEHEHEHHHHHDDECECGCHEHEHHHHDECECGCHEHEHHHDECDCGCHEHEHHHHEHSEECSCGCHGHDHHHHADEVFTSVGIETAKKFTKEEMESLLEKLSKESEYGLVLRAKGIVAGETDWIHFDYVPGEADVRYGSKDVIGRICVIGSEINKEKIEKLFD